MYRGSSSCWCCCRVCLRNRQTDSALSKYKQRYCLTSSFKEQSRVANNRSKLWTTNLLDQISIRCCYDYYPLAGWLVGWCSMQTDKWINWFPPNQPTRFSQFAEKIEWMDEWLERGRTLTTTSDADHDEKVLEVEHGAAASAAMRRGRWPLIIVGIKCGSKTNYFN